MLYVTCFVTVFLLSGPVFFGCLGKSPGETFFLKARLRAVKNASASMDDQSSSERGVSPTEHTSGMIRGTHQKDLRSACVVRVVCYEILKKKKLACAP